MKNQNEENLRKDLKNTLEGYLHDLGCYEYSSGITTQELIDEQNNHVIERILSLFHSRELEIREEVIEECINALKTNMKGFGQFKIDEEILLILERLKQKV